MSAFSIQVPFPVFQGRDGQPLENGYVWIGEPNLNPQTNPVVAYFDAALTIPAPQPLRTLNGYISRAGTPAQVYVDAVNFSILVQDSKGSMVYNFPDGTGISPDACGITYNPSFTGAVPYPVCEKLEQVVSVKDFGAVGDGVTNDTSALQAAIDAASAAQVQLFWPKGVYFITATLIVSSNVNWLGEGGSYSVIKQNGLLQFMMNDNSTPVENVIIDSLGFDFNGYNVANFGTAILFNSVSHENLRIVNNKIFDSDYPGDGNINQRQAIFIGQNPTNIWVLNNNVSEGGRIKIGYGGTNVFIQRNKLNYIDDNGITMAMLGTSAAPSNQITENVHIEDNIIVNPTGNGIFFGADGEDKNDPAMVLKNVSIARNIIVLDTPDTDDSASPRFIIGVIPYNGASDIAINDNICVMTTNTPDAGFSESIRIASVNGAVGTLKRLSISRNKLSTPYKRPGAVVVGHQAIVDDIIISDNYFEGYSDAIFLRLATTINRPTITNNVIKSSDRGIRIDNNPVVTAGSYSRNRIFSPTAADLFASTSAMEWRIESNEILDSAAAAIQLDGAGTKDFYLINNDLRGAVSGPITFTNSAALSADSARYGNLGDTALVTVASASTITIPNVQVVSISGTTNIDTITATGRAGQVATLRFVGVLTVNDGTGNLSLAGNFTTSANDTLTLACTGTAWEEVARSVN
jgi:hypothetical protein